MHHMLHGAVAVALLTLTATVVDAAEGAGLIKGKVTVSGVLLADGKLLLRKPGDKEPLETPIKAGLFSIEMVAAGEYEVAIQGKGVPAKYTAFDVSGLKVAIKSGSNEINFELK